jgi:hypothetical protein
MDGFWVKESSVRADHMNMCKFADRDEGYKRVSGHIKAFVRQAKKVGVIGEQAAPTHVPTGQSTSASGQPLAIAATPNTGTSYPATSTLESYDVEEVA